MSSTIRQFAGAAIVIAALAGAGTAWAADVAAVVAHRQDAMKARGKDLGTIKAFLDGKADLAAAQAAGDDLVKRIPETPGLFPPKTGMEEDPGKSYAKPAIWTEPDKFAAAVKNADAKAQALDAALKGGDKPVIAKAFADLGRNGCGGCHKVFRQPKS